MDQAIEHGVGIGGIADQRVPLIDRELAGDDGGAAAVAVTAWATSDFPVNEPVLAPPIARAALKGNVKFFYVAFWRI